MEMAVVRTESIRKLSGVGVLINPALPMLDSQLVPRDVGAVIGRALALHSVVAASYGFPREEAVKWATREGLWGYLTAPEQDCLQTEGDGIVGFRHRVEALAALGWALSITPACDPFQKLPSSVVSKFPDLLRDEDARRFRSAAHLRDRADVIAALDLLYCAHWALRQAELTWKRPPKLRPLDVVAERRRGLEWVLTMEDWEDVSLDT